MCAQDKGDIDWTPRQIAITIDAFQCGDLFGRLPGGLLSQRYGGKRLLGFTLLVASLSTVLIPLTAGVHFTVVVLLRFIAGFTAVRCICLAFQSVLLLQSNSPLALCIRLVLPRSTLQVCSRVLPINICPSVLPSVKRWNCDKTKETYARILISYERSMHLVF